MKTRHKIYAGLAVFAIVGGDLYWSERREEKQVAAESAATVLPKIGLAKGDAEKITRVAITRPDDDDGTKTRTITLEKQGGGWELTSPITTVASASKVQALIDNLKDLRLKDAVDLGVGSYEEFAVTDAKAVHVAAWRGEEKASDLYFGKSGVRGQFVRVGGVDGVFAMANTRTEGYSGFLYTRDLRSWRETSILKFEEDDAVFVEVTNGHGLFSFSKSEGKWSGSVAKRDPHGKLGAPEPEWRKFDERKVLELLRNYKALSADDFGEEKDRPSSGVDRAEETGGVVHIRLKGQGSDLTLKIGKLSNDTSRWAIKGSRWAIKEGGDGTLYVLSPWTADWATADAKRFEAADADGGI
jgi:hypothetical protein